MEKYIPITGIPAHAEYHEFEDRSWHKGFIIRGQTTIRFRRHHLELLQGIAKSLPLFLSKKIDLSRWEFGYASTLTRSMARIQLRSQLVECNADPAVFHEVQPKNKSEIFMSCFQSAKRCEVDLDLDRLRDTMLDALITSREDLIVVLNFDAKFSSDKERTLSSWGNRNGDILTVTDVEDHPGHMMVTLSNDEDVVYWKSRVAMDRVLEPLATQKNWKKYREIKDRSVDLKQLFACTAHKSQGSTYDVVFLDGTDIVSADNNSMYGNLITENQMMRLGYVAMSRMRKKVVIFTGTSRDYKKFRKAA